MLIYIIKNVLNFIFMLSFLKVKYDKIGLVYMNFFKVIMLKKNWYSKQL